MRQAPGKVGTTQWPSPFVLCPMDDIRLALCSWIE